MQGPATTASTRSLLAHVGLIPDRKGCTGGAGKGSDAVHGQGVACRFVARRVRAGPPRGHGPSRRPATWLAGPRAPGGEEAGTPT
jgi:hypothetical protein